MGVTPFTFPTLGMIGGGIAMVVGGRVGSNILQKSKVFQGFLGTPVDRKVVAGLESNHQNNTLISILFLGSAKSFPHILPHIFVNLTAVRFFVWGESLENKRSAERQANAFPALAI